MNILFNIINKIWFIIKILILIDFGLNMVWNVKLFCYKYDIVI